MLAGEMLHLLRPKAAMTSQAVHEHKRRGPLPSLLIGKPHGVTHEPGHAHSLNHTAPGFVAPTIAWATGRPQVLACSLRPSQG
jgi:hypothetical protein